MSLTALPHLNFAGDARQALEHYRAAFGGHVVVRTYAESGVPRDSTAAGEAAFDPVPADSPAAGQVSFGLLVADDGPRLAAYDVLGSSGGGLAGAPAAGARRADGLTHDESLFLVLNGDTLAEIEPAWRVLAADGTTIQALAPTAWSPAYGMLTDRFGVTWVFGAAS